MPIVGLSVYHGDAAAAVLVDGRFHAGVEEERFTRVKHWAGFPERALRFCVDEAAGGDPGAIRAFAVARQPGANFLRKAVFAAIRPRLWSQALDRLKNRRRIQTLETLIASALDVTPDTIPPIQFVEHHLAHIASAFYCCPWEEAMCLTVDGFGDFVSSMRAIGRGNKIDVLDKVSYPHSLGVFYTAITQYLGFPHYGDEYKMMGMAAYGEPSFVGQLDALVPMLRDGRFALDHRYFELTRGSVSMTWDGGEPHLGTVFSPELPKLLGQPARRSDEPLTQFHKDIAASAQVVYETRLFALVKALQRRTGLKKLALAGGCALNSLANGKLFDRTDVEDVYIQAAAHDGGTSLGAALYVQHAIHDRPREFVMEHAYWGPQSTDSEIRQAIAQEIPGSSGQNGRTGAFEIRSLDDEAALVSETASAIAAGEVVGWYQGRSEWGPRALGNRSILADPRRGDMREVLNVKIKRRESFRPFAPSVLEEHTGDWFTISYPDPFMMKVYPIREDKRPLVPAIAHADGTGRLQTVSARTNRRYYKLIQAFHDLTGIPMVLNTSFNENEPIVNTPTEALACFLRTKMDRLVLGDVVITRVAD